MKKRIVKVHYSNGDTISTWINGTYQEICKYFAVGSWFNIGTVSDDMQQIKLLEFLD